MLDKKALEVMKDINGEVLLNCIFCGQRVLKFRNGKFIVEDMDGSKWKFDEFPQVCYFIVAVRNGNTKECYNDALTLGPNSFKEPEDNFYDILVNNPEAREIFIKMNANCPETVNSVLAMVHNKENREKE